MPQVAMEARELWERTLSGGRLPAVVPFALGTNLLAAEDREDAPGQPALARRFRPPAPDGRPADGTDAGS